MVACNTDDCCWLCQSREGVFVCKSCKLFGAHLCFLPSECCKPFYIWGIIKQIAVAEFVIEFWSVFRLFVFSITDACLYSRFCYTVHRLSSLVLGVYRYGHYKWNSNPCTGVCGNGDSSCNNSYKCTLLWEKLSVFLCHSSGFKTEIETKAYDN